MKKAVLENFAIFSGKYLCWSLQHRCFPVNIVKFLRTPILKNIRERQHPLIFQNVSVKNYFLDQSGDYSFREYDSSISLMRLGSS